MKRCNLARISFSHERLVTRAIMRLILADEHFVARVDHEKDKDCRPLREKLGSRADSWPWAARLQERWTLPRVDSNQRPMEGRPLANTRIRTAGLGQRKYCQRVDVYTHYIILSLTYRQLLYTRWLDEWSWLFVGLWLYLSGSMYICI